MSKRIEYELELMWLNNRAFSSNFGKRPLAKIGGKMIDLTSKLGEINGIEHNMGRNISSKSSHFRLYHAKHTT